MFWGNFQHGPPSKVASFILARSSTTPPRVCPAAGVDPPWTSMAIMRGGPGVVEAPFALGVKQQLGGGVRKADQLGQHLVVQEVTCCALRTWLAALLTFGCYPATGSHRGR